MTKTPEEIAHEINCGGYAMSRCRSLRCAKIAQAIRAARDAALEEAADLAEHFNFYEKCKLDSHDERWCSECESRENGAAQLANEIRALKSKEA